MPIAPLFDWEQTAGAVNLTVQVKGVKKDAVDVFISDVFVKVNAAATYLLQLDLMHPIVVNKAKFSIKDHVLKILLPKAEGGVTWDALCIDKKTPQVDVKERRAAALARAEELYNTKLDTREKQKEVEKKRMLEDHWEMEKQQREHIEQKVKQERVDEEEKLAKWEEETKSEKKSVPTSPADIFQQQQAAAPKVRQLETVNVPINFTRKSTEMPTRSRTDDEYYRRSKYKPVRVEDSPVFWKEKGDRSYKTRDWKAAIEAYSEAIKRDGSYLACVSNRSAAYIQVGDYAKAVGDCDLALNMLANIPAADTTQEQYRRTLIRLHTRRGAAHAWNGDVAKGMEDYRLAAAYRDKEVDEDVMKDLETITEYMKVKGLVELSDPSAMKRSEAGQLYYKGNYAAAAETYQELLAQNEFDVKARSNLCATYLHQGAFKEALAEADKLIEFFAEVATALNQPGAQGSTMEDSDDEEDCEDEPVA